MSKIRSSKTGFEKKIFRELRKSGVRFKTHYGGVIGKPDIAQPKSRKAVFLHSDFWHGWRLPSWEHILPSEFWKTKLKKNRARDRKVVLALRRNGWRVMILWEHSYAKDPTDSVTRIARFLK
ncbi:MAG: very short patch repair endonuclease [Candidatus Liptonbacteria bacterium]|nr:very short patch repair endonuclease [Candidatus Liptonbacteria bacterium]